MKSVRVRFAPSPTGALHLGGARTALYNFLLARKLGGEMILRIEDTDRGRYIEGAEGHIIESLRWLGIQSDEGPEQGGPFAPYRQSEAKELYRQHAQRLIDAGRAYFAFDTEEELEEMRAKLKVGKKDNPQYDSATRGRMKNSLTLAAAEVQERLKRNDPFVVRLKTPEDETLTFHDLIRGDIVVHTAQLDDKVLIKSDGMPTYHLAHVVDDHRMQISHVVRGEEWLSSTPFHLLVHRYLGWGADIPQFAHLPLLLKPEGPGKLSKRDAEKVGFPILPIAWTNGDTGETMPGFREEGYLPEALVNFLALLGWNPGDEREFFTLPELVEVFDIGRIGKSGARPVFSKIKWFNQRYLRLKPSEELAKTLLDALIQRGIPCSPDRALRAVETVRDRAVLASDLYALSAFFFEAPAQFDANIRDRVWSAESQATLDAYADELEGGDAELSEGQADEAMQRALLRHPTAAKGKAMQAARLALTGGAFGPDLVAIAAFLGRKEVISRLRRALKTLS